MSLNDHYEKSLGIIEDQYPYFTTEVIGTGTPRASTQVDTAAISWDPKNPEKWSFIFNEEFAEKLNEDEMAFIVAHETMHVALRHFDICSSFDDPIRFNIAADCVINDFLVGNGMSPPEGLCTGQDYINRNASGMTVSDVYALLPDEVNQDNPDYGGGQGGQVDEHDWMLSDEAKEALGKAMDAVEKGSVAPSDLDNIMDEDKLAEGGWSKEGVGNVVVDDHEYGFSGDWLKLLMKVNPMLRREFGLGPKPRSTFRTPSRKVGHMYPDILVPRYESIEGGGDISRSDKKASIVLAVDVSGSIPTEWVRKFRALIMSKPKKMHMYCCTFDTDYHEVLDVNNPVNTGGGTDFSAIQAFINDRVMPDLGQYPRAVCVITDGQARFSSYYHPESTPTQAQLDNFLFMVPGWNPDIEYSGGAVGSYAKSGNSIGNDITVDIEQIHDLNEYIEGNDSIQ